MRAPSRCRIGLQAGVTLLLLSGSGAAAQTTPERGAVDAPRIAGIALGDSVPGVLRALGQPDRRQESLGFRFWDYRSRAMSLTWDRTDDRVHVVVVSDSMAGAVDGVRVGDPATAVARRWGSPARVRAHGRFLDFVRRGWTCTAEVRDGRVAEITMTLAR